MEFVAPATVDPRLSIHRLFRILNYKLKLFSFVLGTLKNRKSCTGMEKLQSRIFFNFTIIHFSFLILLQFYLLARESLTSIFLSQFINI